MVSCRAPGCPIPGGSGRRALQAFSWPQVQVGFSPRLVLRCWGFALAQYSFNNPNETHFVHRLSRCILRIISNRVFTWPYLCRHTARYTLECFCVRTPSIHMPIFTHTQVYIYIYIYIYIYLYYTDTHTFTCTCPCTCTCTYTYNKHTHTPICKYAHAPQRSWTQTE